MLRRQAQERKRNLCARLRSFLDSLHGGLLHTTRLSHTNSRLDSFRGGIHVGRRKLESNCHRYDERCCRKIMVHNLYGAKRTEKTKYPHTEKRRRIRGGYGSLQQSKIQFPYMLTADYKTMGHHPETPTFNHPTASSSRKMPRRIS